MEISRFVNSKDVREYWQKLKLQFTLPEACYLIWTSECSEEEKHAAWLEATTSFSDCAVKRGSHGFCVESFAKFLQENINAENWDAIDDAFDEMWFNWPVPFKKGDIVCSKHGAFGYGNKTEVFVLECLCTESKRAERLAQSGCSMDMTADGVFQLENGVPYWECQHRYFDMEFYRGELVGKQRILKPISALMKGDAYEPLALQAYAIICKEEKIPIKPDYLNVTDEEYAKVGLTRRKK